MGRVASRFLECKPPGEQAGQVHPSPPAAAAVPAAAARLGPQGPAAKPQRSARVDVQPGLGPGAIPGQGVVHVALASQGPDTTGGGGPGRNGAARRMGTVGKPPPGTAQVISHRRVPGGGPGHGSVVTPRNSNGGRVGGPATSFEQRRLDAITCHPSCWGVHPAMRRPASPKVGCCLPVPGFRVRGNWNRPHLS